MDLMDVFAREGLKSEKRGRYGEDGVW